MGYCKRPVALLLEVGLWVIENEKLVFLNLEVFVICEYFDTDLFFWRDCFDWDV